MAHAVQMRGQGENGRRSLGNNLNNKAWYAIYTTQPSTNNNNLRVFTDLLEAVTESKKLNARFNRFSSEVEARKFAETGLVDSPAIGRSRPHLKENKEKSPARKGAISARSSLGDEHTMNKTCPSVHTRDLTKFRISIEKGDLQGVLDCINENPRFLISSIDKPVIIQLSVHYNALHCAAIKGQTDVAEEMMNYLLSDKPWVILYPNEDVTQSLHLERRAIVIDGYLNTSDKGWGETPLHFACKNGHLSFARWLLSFNQTDITRRNKSDQTAEEVAGTRCAGTEAVQREVSALILQSRHSVYVPVVRAVDNSTPPFLGQPVTPEYLHCKRGSSSGANKIMLGELSEDDSLLSADFDTSLTETSFSRHSLGTMSPLRPSLSICAYAGPLPVSDAREFRKVWKTPPRELSSWRRDTLQDIMRSDSDRGLERVGRDLAVQQKVAWREYWEFLGSFVNLREDEGLQMLDDYLLNCDHQFISGETPSKLDQDVLHALPQGGIAQLSDKFPNICNWYKEVLGYPEDERKCWTTPVAVRKTKPRSDGTPSTGHLRASDTGIVRNLLSDMSLHDDIPDEVVPSDKEIQEILVEGVSKLSVSETNKLFPKTYQPDPNLCNIDINEQLPSAVKPATSTPKERLPLPISSNSVPRDNSWLVGSNEPRQRYSKSSIVETDSSNIEPRGRVRRYISHQILRWLLLFIVVWTVYFVLVYFQLGGLVPGGNDRNL